MSRQRYGVLYGHDPANLLLGFELQIETLSMPAMAFSLLSSFLPEELDLHEQQLLKKLQAKK